MKKAKFMAVILISALLCGCADVDGDVSVVNPVDVSGESTFSTQSKVEINLKETMESPRKCGIYKMKNKTYSDNQLLSLFNGTPEKNVEQSTAGYSMYDKNDQHGFVYDSRNLNFYTETGLLLEEVYGSLESPNDNAELSFAARDDVLKKVQNELQDKFNISPDEWWAYGYFAVKKDEVDQYKEFVMQEANKIAENSDDMAAIDKAKKRVEQISEISSEDFYYMDIKFKIGEIPLYMGNALQYGSDETFSVMGSFVSLIYTKNGIELLSLYYVNEIDNLADKSGEVEIIDADKARELVSQKFLGIINDAVVEVSNIQLVYLPIPKNNTKKHFEEFEARPFYACDYTQTEKYNGNEYTSNFTVYFDAVTGKELGVEAR